MRASFISVLAVMLLAPTLAFAANLSVYPASVVLKKGDSVGFMVHLQSKADINTLGASVILPKGLTFLNAVGGTVVSQWIQMPTYNAAESSVTFSGINTNGWQGDGVVATIRVAAKEEGTYSLDFDKEQTELYRNDGKATPEPVVYGAAAIPLLPPQGMAIIGLIIIVLIVLVVWVRRKYKITFV